MFFLGAGELQRLVELGKMQTWRKPGNHPSVLGEGSERNGRCSEHYLLRASNPGQDSPGIILRWEKQLERCQRAFLIDVD